jgi:hypothetical protein
MAYTREEMETLCRYDYVNNYWIVDTNVQKHITKLLKIAGQPLNGEWEDSKGENAGTRLIYGRWILGNSQVRLAKLIERNTANDAEENEDEDTQD